MLIFAQFVIEFLRSISIILCVCVCRCVFVEHAKCAQQFAGSLKKLLVSRIVVEGAQKAKPYNST